MKKTIIVLLNILIINLISIQAYSFTWDYCGDDVNTTSPLSTGIPPEGDCGLIRAGFGPDAGNQICVYRSGSWTWANYDADVGRLLPMGCTLNRANFIALGSRSGELKFLRCGFGFNEWRSFNGIDYFGIREVDESSFYCYYIGEEIHECAAPGKHISITNTLQYNLGDKLSQVDIVCAVENRDPYELEWKPYAFSDPDDFIPYGIDVAECSLLGTPSGYDCCMDTGHYDNTYDDCLEFGDVAGDTCYYGYQNNICTMGGWICEDTSETQTKEESGIVAYSRSDFPSTPPFNTEGFRNMASQEVMGDREDLCYYDEAEWTCLPRHGWSSAFEYKQSIEEYSLERGIDPSFRFPCRSIGEVIPSHLGPVCYINGGEILSCEAYGSTKKRQGGWLCSPDPEHPPVPWRLPSFENNNCYYGINETQGGGDGCIPYQGWAYLTDTEKPTDCLGTGQVYGNRCYMTPVTYSCERGYGWTCTNGSYDESALQTCSHYGSACPGLDCIRNEQCVESQCSADGWTCFGDSRDIGCSVECYDRDQNGLCDCRSEASPVYSVAKGSWDCSAGSQIIGNRALDRDGDGILNAYDTENNVDDCLDGYDNDGDGQCDSAGCTCNAANNYCGTFNSGITSMPRDANCPLTCSGDKPDSCSYHLGICNGVSCELHSGCTGNRCEGTDWQCYGDVRDTPCSVNCYDRNNNNVCDCITSSVSDVAKLSWACTAGTDIGSNNALDTDGDGILTQYDTESAVGDDCNDGVDNDGDGFCDSFGCRVDDVDLPADPGCNAECTRCNDCGQGIFNLCDEDECISGCSDLPGRNCYFWGGFWTGDCCLDNDGDTYCEDCNDVDGDGFCDDDTNDPFDECIGQDDRIDNDLDGVKDCIDPYLNCNSDGVCQSPIPGTSIAEACSCPDCNLRNADECAVNEVCIEDACHDFDESSEFCEYYFSGAQGICDSIQEAGCWDSFMDRFARPMSCCGDDEGSDNWVNEMDPSARTGCVEGEFCTQNIILDDELNPVGCCPNPTDIPNPPLTCTETSMFKKPVLTNGTVATGSVSGELIDSEFYAGNQDITVEKDGKILFSTTAQFSGPGKKTIYGDVQADQDIDIDDTNEAEQISLGNIPTPTQGTVRFIASDADGNGVINANDVISISLKQVESLPLPIEELPAGRELPEGFVSLAGLLIESSSPIDIHINAEELMKERLSNRISDVYSVYIENPGATGLIICTDPEEGNGNFGDPECSNLTALESGQTTDGFTLTQEGQNFKITTDITQHYDWYAYIKIVPNLEIYDDSDKDKVFTNEDIGFYANLTNPTTGNFIQGAVCNIIYTDEEGEESTPFQMTEEPENRYYYAERQYDKKGTYNWRVECFHSLYEDSEAEDTVTVYPNSELIITDSTDTETRFVGEEVDFTATFRDARNTQPIADAVCTITYHDDESELMLYNSETKKYTAERSYSQYGFFIYTVRCEKAGYDPASELDIVEIFPESCSVSELSDEDMASGVAKFKIVAKKGFVLVQRFWEE